MGTIVSLLILPPDHVMGITINILISSTWICIDVTSKSIEHEILFC